MLHGVPGMLHVVPRVCLHRVPWGRGYATWCTPTQGTMGEGLCYMVYAYTGYHGGGAMLHGVPGMLHVVPRVCIHRVPWGRVCST
jgi:hypothetical protein